MIHNTLIIANDKLQIAKRPEYKVHEVHHTMGKFMYQDEYLKMP
jgi:hypothetical protein